MNTAPDKDSLGFYPFEILALLYRRRVWILLSLAASVVAAAALIVLQKPLYRSSATLLIETQAIPTSVIASPLTNIANDRIAKIRQQITSRDRLTDLIIKLKLYRVERQARPMPEVVQMMREAIIVDLVSAAQQSAGEGNTIAFTLSFNYKDPAIAQAVTRQLTDMFQVEDKRFRTAQANGTATFLGRRAEELRSQLTQLEDKRRAIKARYAGALPEQIAVNAQSGAALRAEVSRIDAETQGLMQQNGLLAARETELGQAPTPAVEALRRSEERLASLTAIYSDQHPDVVAAKAAVERQARRAETAGAGERPFNVIETEIAAGRSRMAMMAGRRSSLIANMADMEHRAALGPQASYELNTVDREFDNLKRQYESLREKQMEAQVAANLQSEDKGERFSVVDEPSFPHTSLGSKRSTILLNSLLAGLAIGVGGVLGLEFLRGTIQGPGSLARVLLAVPMGVIPRARPVYPQSKRWRNLQYLLVRPSRLQRGTV
jgi:uncharacterized protein involved in exopolysaccharide biosynthesis